MKLHKYILNQDWAQTVVATLAAAYLRFVRLSGRWEVRGWDNIQPLLIENHPVILCFWHGRLIANIFGWRADKPLYQLSTAHRDGKLAGKTYARLGVTPIWLESKSPTEATRKMVKILKAGGVCAITPDGPKGPRQRMQMSAIDLARLSGAVLIPVTNSSTRVKVLDTWDRMQVPLPFGHGIFAVGEAVRIPREASANEREVIRKRMEETLNVMTRELDIECGQTTPCVADETAS